MIGFIFDTVATVASLGLLVFFVLAAIILVDYLILRPMRAAKNKHRQL